MGGPRGLDPPKLKGTPLFENLIYPLHTPSTPTLLPEKKFQHSRGSFWPPSMINNLQHLWVQSVCIFWHHKVQTLLKPTFQFSLYVFFSFLLVFRYGYIFTLIHVIRWTRVKNVHINCSIELVLLTEMFVHLLLDTVVKYVNSPLRIKF